MSVAPMLFPQLKPTASLRGAQWSPGLEDCAEPKADLLVLGAPYLDSMGT